MICSWTDSAEKRMEPNIYQGHITQLQMAWLTELVQSFNNSLWALPGENILLNKKLAILKFANVLPAVPKTNQMPVILLLGSHTVYWREQRHTIGFPCNGVGGIGLACSWWAVVYCLFDWVGNSLICLKRQILFSYRSHHTALIYKHVGLAWQRRSLVHWVFVII